MCRAWRRGSCWTASSRCRIRPVQGAAVTRAAELRLEVAGGITLDGLWRRFVLPLAVLLTLAVDNFCPAGRPAPLQRTGGTVVGGPASRAAWAGRWPATGRAGPAHPGRSRCRTPGVLARRGDWAAAHAEPSRRGRDGPGPDPGHRQRGDRYPPVVLRGRARTAAVGARSCAAVASRLPAEIAAMRAEHRRVTVDTRSMAGGPGGVGTAVRHARAAVPSRYGLHGLAWTRPPGPLSHNAHAGAYSLAFRQLSRRPDQQDIALTSGFAGFPCSGYLARDSNLRDRVSGTELADRKSADSTPWPPPTSPADRAPTAGRGAPSVLGGRASCVDPVKERLSAIPEAEQRMAAMITDHGGTLVSVDKQRRRSASHPR